MTLTLKVKLADVRKPPVWRRIEVPNDVTLAGLHDAIQGAMGWTDSHDHEFSWPGMEEGASVDEGAQYALPLLSLGRQECEKAGKVRGAVREHMLYVYDLGDCWEHLVTLEKENGKPGPDGFELIAVSGACPPEEIGGPSGFSDFKAVMADETHDEHEDTVHWLIETTGRVEFDPHETGFEKPRWGWFKNEEAPSSSSSRL